ncbi:hypothetical protein OH779_04900 [Actinacidiphila glaucinigra]|uniref:hypothetical protein n=1 Tax=Actinacidiphila glaucinigra TaxID=235986 RepID=UPI003862F672
MDAQVWTSLPGVALGGGFSFLGQITAGRQAARSEGMRREADVAEARGAERVSRCGSSSPWRSRGYASPSSGRAPR